ncbi:inositol monophosphatase [Devosia nitrariae]|uniref:Inositol monophosphatase n=1 Tax=Devosia nitrariae TaxID=2071872 RepID=A0ABQ5WB76_9HYPH|nr:inositol monophosphatase [Devosia nitrariae]GLQ57380.1 inositol monophosphatase [Devosia nitrariae]
MNIERLAQVLREAAQQEIMPRFRRLDEGMIRTKSSATDLVTEADEAAERAITKAILAHNPDHLVIGEEAVAADPALLDSPIDDRIAIFIDPVDGTYNFASGLPLFAVMAAVVQNGQTVAGIIYDPLGDDWIMAEKGTGAWQVFPDGRMTRLSFASPVPVSGMTGAASTSFLPGEARRTVMANLSKVAVAANYRCAGHEYRLAAGGNMHFQMYSKLMPWDHLAGALIVAEAGAYLARFDGSAYRPEHRDGGLIIAPDEAGWEALRREIFTI